MKSKGTSKNKKFSQAGLSLTITRSTVVACLQLVSRCVDEEVSELPTEGAEAAHLPVHPVETLLTLRGIRRNELAVLLRKVLNNGR